MIFTVPPLSAVLLLALASVGSVAAVPSPFDYPEVIPGPGMPSLASLGLTSKDLYEETVTAPQIKRELLTRSDCRSHPCGQPPRGDAQACVNYLRNLGTQACGVNSGGTVMCTAGQAVISGTALNGAGHTSSYCSDVAVGGQYIVDNCNDGFGYVAGRDVANGNGDLVVSIGRC